jgi:type VI secretion system protein ImpL
VPLADFGRLFGYDGVFDAFFKDNMEKLVDSSESPWTWRQGGVKPPGMLARFEMARRVRETFFRPGTQSPALRFTVTLTDLDPSATRFILEIDGQRFDVGHSAPRKNAVAWPGSSTGEAIATFEDRSGAWPSLKFDSPWAWFRLIDAGQPQRESDLRAALTFQNSGHQVRVIVEAVTIHNPFTTRDWQHFSCGS